MNLKFLNQKANKYFDFTASGLCIESIETEIRQISSKYANTHSKHSALSAYMNECWDSARKNLFQTLDVNPYEFEIISTGFGSTAAIKKFQELIGIYIPPKTKKRCNLEVKNVPLVLIGPYEHHSNDVSYRESIADLIRLKLDEDGSIDVLDLEEKLIYNKGREIYICVSVASNVTGIITDIEKISKLAREHNAFVCLDAATSSPYLNISSYLYDVMFLSPHKAIGGPGSTGLLIIRRSLVDLSLPPTFGGGGTVCYVNSEQQFYEGDLHVRETAGTPGILQFIKASKAYKLRNDFGLEKIKSIKKDLHAYFVEKLSVIEGVTIYGNTNLENIGICSFNIDCFSPYELCEILSNEYELETRAGCSCAGPYGHILLGLDNDPLTRPDDVGWLRVSIHYTHTKNDLDFLLMALKEIVSTKNKKTIQYGLKHLKKE